jgi:hypothetical protein
MSKKYRLRKCCEKAHAQCNEREQGIRKTSISNEPKKYLGLVKIESKMNKS